MITPASQWSSANAAPLKMPIYAFAVGAEALYTTHDLTRFGVTGAPAYSPWLTIPTGASQSIDIVQCTSSIGELQCEVLDVGGAVRQFVGATTLVGLTATLSVGYPGLSWAQFVPLHTYTVYKINPSDGYTSFIFVCRDPQLLEKTTIYLHPENGGLLSDDNPWYVCGSPIDVYLSVLLFAVGLPASAVDLAWLQQLNGPAEGLYYSARPFLFRLTESFQAKQFLETEVFKPSLLYQVVLNTGQLSLRAPKPPAAGASPVFTFTQDNMTVLPKMDRQPLMNEAVWQFDSGGSDGSSGSDYGSYNTYVEADSILAFGRGDQQFRVDSKGLRTPCGAFWWSQWVSRRLFRRFAGGASSGSGELRGGAPVYNIEAFLMTLPVWTGDYVAVTHPRIPDVVTGNLGIAGRVMEVIDREPDYQNGKMTYKLLDTGLTGLAPAAVWGSGTNAFKFGQGRIY